MKKSRIDGPRDLTHQQDFLRQVIDINPNLIFVKNRSGRFVLVNQAVADAYGATVSSLVGKRDVDFNSNEEEVAHFEQDDREVMDTQQEKLIPLEALTGKDGQIRYLQTIKRPLVDPDGVARHVLGVATDVTLLKQSEQERRDLHAQVLHAQKMESLGVLAGGIAHDFNNLLMGVMGYADLAQMELSADSPASKSIQQVQLAAQSAAELCKHLLDYSGKGHSLIEVMNLTEVVEEIKDLLGISASRNVVLHLELDRSLPLIEADITQVRQIIMNLVSNASDAITEPNGVISVITGTMDVTRANRVDVFTAEELKIGPHVYLEVSDNGSGMTPETIGKIFDPFFTTKFSGRGLGLAAVMGIVRAHHAGIQVESSPERGTTFKVLFQVKEDAVTQHDGPGEASAALHVHGAALVVDDEEMVRKVTEGILNRIGFTVLTAQASGEGLELLGRRADEIKLVLFDLSLVGEKETFRKLQELGLDAPVVLMSDQAEPDLGPFEELPVAGFLTKPFGVQDVMQCLVRIQQELRRTAEDSL